MNLPAEVAQALRTRCAADDDHPLLVAVSGGVDSMVLLHALHAVGFRLIVAHFDHRLRPDSAHDRDFVAAQAAELGLPFVSDAADVAAFARQQKCPLEAAARELRYRFLFRAARDCGAQGVVTAHHADDQAETILLHLLRGTGIGGLRGMLWRWQPVPWDDELPLLRPMLGLKRTQIEAWAQSQGLVWREDPTNRQAVSLRNRLRHEVLPLLEQLAPDVKMALWRLSDVAAAEDDLLEQLTGEALQDVLLGQGPDWFVLDAVGLKSLPLALERRLLRNLLPEADFATIERVLAHVRQGCTASQTLPGNWRMWCEEQRIWLAGPGSILPLEAPQLPAQHLPVQVPGITPLGNGWVLKSRSVFCDERLLAQVRQNRDSFQAWLDAAVLGEPVLQAPAPGWRMQPLGLGGHRVKLQDVFVNMKIPARLRSRWPVLVGKGQVAWVPGYRPAQAFALQPETETAIHFHLFREE